MKTFFRGLVARRLEAAVQKLVAERGVKVVAVTGSVGKTSTKLAIASVLRTKFKVLAQEGNYNTEIGLPLSVFELETPATLYNPLAWLVIFVRIWAKRRYYPYDVLVLEMGVDHPGEMDLYLRYLKPDVGVVTAVAPVHLEGFKTVGAVLQEKFKLALASQVVVLNADDQRLMGRRKELTQKVVTFGQAGDIVMTDAVLEPEGMKVTLKLARTVVPVQTHVVGEHSLKALEAAAAVGELMEVPVESIQAGVGLFRPVKGRMNPLPGQQGSIIIDDSYNSSPDAALAALETLASMSGRRFAILGTMNELGEHEAEGHRQVGEAAAKAGLDLLVTIGQPARDFLAATAINAGLSADKVQSFDSPYEAGYFVAERLRAGDVVLVKGSQNRVFAEEATKLLLEDPDDANQLVRQSPGWLKKKKQQFEVKSS